MILSRELPLSPSTVDAAGPPALRVRVLEWLLIFGLFAAYARWPVPDPNEPHYLGKAKAFWNPQWIVGDAFLDSPETHVLFYATFGWLTHFMSLPTLAWCGRFLSWGLLAAAWRRLSWAAVPRPGFSLLSAGLLLLLQDKFHMAGEWVVGGFEAKGLAYACVFMGLEQTLRARWNRAWLWLGFASGWHVLVGGWATVAVGFAWLVMGSHRAPLRQMVPGLLGGLLLALPGLIPAALLSRGVDPQLVSQANQIYVFERISHHLWCPAFPERFVMRHLLAWCLWLALCFRMPMSTAQKCLQRAVLGSGLISVCGALLTAVLYNHPDAAAAVLRFYWYRLADAMLPVGLAVAIMGRMELAVSLRPNWARVCLVSCALLIGYFLLAPHVVGPMTTRHTPRADKPGKVLDYPSWVDACHFIRDNTSQHARVMTPRQSQTFKWYAERAETATWKDTPQDPATIVDWWRALDEIHATHWPPPADRWFESLAERRPEDLVALAHEYRTDYLLTAVEPRLPFERLYANEFYAVYQLPAGDAPGPRVMVRPQGTTDATVPPMRPTAP